MNVNREQCLYHLVLSSSFQFLPEWRRKNTRAPASLQLPAGVKAVTVPVRRNKNNLPTAKPLPETAKALSMASHYGRGMKTALIAVRGFHAPGYVAVAVLGIVNLLECSQGFPLLALLLIKQADHVEDFLLGIIHFY